MPDCRQRPRVAHEKAGAVLRPRLPCPDELRSVSQLVFETRLEILPYIQNFFLNTPSKPVLTRTRVAGSGMELSDIG